MRTLDEVTNSYIVRAGCTLLQDTDSIQSSSPGRVVTGQHAETTEQQAPIRQGTRQ